MHESKAALFRVLANDWRLRVLDAMRAGPISARDIRFHLAIDQATLSKLRAHDRVQADRRGTTVVYEISHPAIWSVLDAARLLFDSKLKALQAALGTTRA